MKKRNTIDVEANRQAIVRALGISMEDYNTAVLNSGYAYIKRFLRESDPEEKLIMETLSRSGRFWKWWVNARDLRDDDFVRVTGINLLDKPLEGKVWKAAFDEYTQLNDPLMICERPNYLVIEEVAKLIQQEEQKLAEIQTRK